MKVWIEGRCSLSGVLDMAVFSSPEKVVEYWKSRDPVCCDVPLDRQLENAKKKLVSTMDCYIGLYPVELHAACAAEVDRDVPRKRKRRKDKSKK